MPFCIARSIRLNFYVIIRKIEMRRVWVISNDFKGVSYNKTIHDLYSLDKRMKRQVAEISMVLQVLCWNVCWHLAPMTAFFFRAILCCSQRGDDLQIYIYIYLAKFGYPFYIFGYLFEPCIQMWWSFSSFGQILAAENLKKHMIYFSI